MAVFAVCLIVDIIRRETIEKVFLKWLNKNYDVWVEKSIPEKIKKGNTSYIKCNSQQLKILENLIQN